VVAVLYPGNIEHYLPLSEATYYVMLALVEPLHGYGVMQKVEQISEGTVKMGPGTLYGVLTSLEKSGLIIMVKEEDRRKYYNLTTRGKMILALQIKRLEIMTKNGLAIKSELD
jgi:DNA-binding PadR family transcriptional regulator